MTYVDGIGSLNGLSLAGRQTSFVCVSDDVYVQLAVRLWFVPKHQIH